MNVLSDDTLADYEGTMLLEYENLEALMVQFCRVPLLAEFSRPVALLHPEVSDSFAFLSSIFLSQRSDFFSS